MQVVQEIGTTKSAKFVQVLEDGKEFVCELPIAHNFNDGTGALFYINRGFVPFDQYMDEKHQKDQKAKRDKGEK